MAILSNPKPLDGLLEVTDWSKAQEHTNFVLLRPKNGSGWEIGQPTVRGESKKTYSSLRFVAKRGPIEVRLKQTLNDWWVPVANDVNLRRVQSHAAIGEEVAMVGTDYHRRPGACAQVLGTTVEAYAQSGEPTGQDWTDLYASLEAAVPTTVPELRKTSFAQRNYWMRWGRDTGPWDSHEYTRPKWMKPDAESFAKAEWASTPDRWAPMPGAPDSVAVLQAKGRRETQVLFRAPMTLNHSSWLRVSEPADSEGPVGRRDPRYPQKWSTTTVEGKTVEYGTLDPAVGTWFFAWREGERALELHVRAKVGLDAKKAFDVARPVVRAP